MKNNNKKSIFQHISQLAAVPGNKGAIVRLCLVAVTLIGGLFLTLGTLPPIADGFGDWLTANITGALVSIMLAGLMWGFAKWTGFIFPKAFAGARRFWNSLHALSLFAFAIKVMVWIYLLMLPLVLYGIVLMPLSLVVYLLSLIGPEFISVTILALLFIFSLFLMVLMDVCKLKDLSWKQTLKEILTKCGQTLSAATRKVVAATQKAVAAKGR